MSLRIFISHSWHDIHFARNLNDALRAKGHSVFLDAHSVGVGDSIPSRINSGLEECDIFIPVLSFQALESKWVKAEINAALILQNEDGRPLIIPVLAEDCSKNLPPLLKSLRYVKFVARYDAGLSELVKGINTFSVQRRQALDANEIQDEEAHKRTEQEQIRKAKIQAELAVREQAAREKAVREQIAKATVESKRITQGFERQAPKRECILPSTTGVGYPCCILALLALLGPRVNLVLIWVFNNPYLTRAVDNFVVQLLGVIFLPWTSLAYAFAFNTFPGGTVAGLDTLGALIVLVGLLLDLGSYGGGYRIRSYSYSG